MESASGREERGSLGKDHRVTAFKRQLWGRDAVSVLAELRTVRVEMFGLGGRERSGSLGVVGSGLEHLERPLWPIRYSSS